MFGKVKAPIIILSLVQWPFNVGLDRRTTRESVCVCTVDLSAFTVAVNEVQQLSESFFTADFFNDHGMKVADIKTYWHSPSNTNINSHKVRSSTVPFTP